LSTSSYSTDLTQCNFFFFPCLKGKMHGHQLQLAENIVTATGTTRRGTIYCSSLLHMVKTFYETPWSLVGAYQHITLHSVIIPNTTTNNDSN
jgi:hypothetical protein